MSNRGFIAIVAAVAFVALLGYGIVAKGKARPEIGDVLPDESVQRLGEEQDASLADYRGEWVLVNLWASWCKPCIDESDALEAYSKEHAKDVKVVGIDTDDASTDALAFAKANGVTYDLLHDGEGLFKDAWGATGLPETMLVDPEGKLAFRFIGQVDKAQLDASVTPLIGPKGST
jgi:cytochrome c biogenesis protein CcmG/thiol:disulfide interchange protein DsbE